MERDGTMISDRENNGTAGRQTLRGGNGSTRGDRPRTGVARRMIGFVAGSLGATLRIAGSLRRIGVPTRVSSTGEGFDRWTFMGCPLTRGEPDARRIVYIGELTPRAGVAEFLSCAAVWAHSHPDVPVDITWLGEGDLLGVLRAQPLPANLIQTFARIPPSDRLVDHLGRCGLLAAPNLADPRLCWIAEAMAAGLPVLGSNRNSQVRALVGQDESGWLFDPLREREMAAALTAAMTATAERLDAMRAAARARIQLSLNEHSGETVRRMTTAKLAYPLADNASA